MVCEADVAAAFSSSLIGGESMFTDQFGFECRSHHKTSIKAIADFVCLIFMLILQILFLSMKIKPILVSKQMQRYLLFYHPHS